MRIPRRLFVPLVLLSIGLIVGAVLLLLPREPERMCEIVIVERVDNGQTSRDVALVPWKRMEELHLEPADVRQGLLIIADELFDGVLTAILGGPTSSPMSQDIPKAKELLTLVAEGIRIDKQVLKGSEWVTVSSDTLGWEVSPMDDSSESPPHGSSDAP